MYHAVESDFDRVYEIFKLHREWFPHVRTDKLKRQIERKQLIIENDVVITYKYYKVKTKIGKEVQALPNDCILHQIVAKKSGTASAVLQKFFKYTKRKVFLSVRRDNDIASKFYLKNDMRLVGEHNWAKNGVKNALPGDVYLYDKNVEITMETK